MERLKCGVVGLGRIGWCHHCQKIQERDDLELTCVVDPLAERREEAITTFNPHSAKKFYAFLRQSLVNKGI